MTEAGGRQLHAAVDHLWSDVSELHERIDVAEWVLASRGETAWLEGGKP